jgi:stress response protein YsnF
VDVPLIDEQIDVQRVEVNRFVDAPPPVRQEGDVTIVPVMEEVLVVTKRLRVKHELRLTRQRHTRREKRRVTLKSEEAHVLRSPAQPD